MPLVKFFVEGQSQPIEVEVEVGAKINQAAYKAGVQIVQTCGGTPSCTDCTVIIQEEAAGGSLEAMELAEKQLLGNVYHITKERLSCQAVIKDSLSIKVLKGENYDGKEDKKIRQEQKYKSYKKGLEKK